MTRAACILIWLTLAATATVRAGPAVSAESRDGYWTRVPFTEIWAKRLRGFKTIADLQRLAGSPGRMSESSGRKTFVWASEPPSHTGGGWMLATVTPGGYIGVGITLIDGPSIVLNNCGGFMCDECTPPIDAPGCGVPTESQ